MVLFALRARLGACHQWTVLGGCQSCRVKWWLAVSDELLIALVGTRQRVVEICVDVTKFMESLHRSTIIVTGDGTGTDHHVKKECDRIGLRCIECHVRKVDGKWAGLWAGPERNEVIARLAHRVVAWPRDTRDTGMSAGTWNCVDQFVKRGKSVSVREHWRWSK
jgi:hypothetical protein